MEVTVATKHLKILKMPAKVVLNIPSLPLELFLPAAYCNLSWLLSELLSFKISEQLGIIHMQLNLSPGAKQFYSHHRFIGGLSKHKYTSYFYETSAYL